ncbi:MAG: GTPase HflX [Halanaerobiales bacterium]
MIGKKDISLNELYKLALTARIKVIGQVKHSTEKINPAFYIGKGKLEELKQTINTNEANLVIFDHELSPAQHTNLENYFNVDIIDRTQLILDIFNLHANTRESKLQVEKARLEYLLPRLTGSGEEMSRLAGGIGTRGPGEAKLEVDRRRISKRIHRLKEKLKNIKNNRQQQRKDRKDPIIALVGYTNAGKSTLLNRLTKAKKEVADKLFATLDSTLRQMELPNGRKVILTDTVGFIRNLPHQLIASFQATLEEIKEANLILHVVDSSDPQAEKHIKVTNKVLKDLGLKNKDKLIIFNKIDKADDSLLHELKLQHSKYVEISALTGKGEKKLLEKITQIFEKDMITVNLKIPYEEAGWLDILHESGNVIKEKYSNNAINITAHITERIANQLNDYRI